MVWIEGDDWVVVGELKRAKVAFENDSWSQMNIFQSSFRSGEDKRELKLYTR